MENVVKQTELLEKTGVYDEDLKRRFSLTLKYSGLKGKKILVIGMNPASNNVQVFDNTTNYLLNNLGMMGYSEIIIWNLFADICTKLKPTQAYDNAENMEYLQTLLEETEGIYAELRTIHPLFAGQRFSGKWKFRNYSFPEEKEEE